jgi:hypothetical protein
VSALGLHHALERLALLAHELDQILIQKKAFASLQS